MAQPHCGSDKLFRNGSKPLKIKTILTATAAVSLVAFSAQAQLLGGQAGGGLTGGVTGATGQVAGQVQGNTQVNPGSAISTTEGAVRDTTARSRGVIEATGQDARGVADATKDVDVAGGVTGNGQVSTDGVKGAVDADADVSGIDGLTSATKDTAKNTGRRAKDTAKGVASTPLPDAAVSGSVSGSGSVKTDPQ